MINIAADRQKFMTLTSN